MRFSSNGNWTGRRIDPRFGPLYWWRLTTSAPLPSLNPLKFDVVPPNPTILKRSGLLLFLLFGLLSTAGSQSFTDSNLPILVIETNGQVIPDEPKITVEMGLIANPAGERNGLDDAFLGYEGWAGLEVRGSTSQELFDKKSYALETRTATADNRNVSLLGMPKENDWVLHGPYSDKSLIRNALAYRLAALVTDYAPRIRFVELVIDGSYEGLYLLTEKIKRDKNRVAISKLRPEDESGDPLTGGYILKIDKMTGVNSSGFVSEHPPRPGSTQQVSFLYHEPKGRDITAVQQAYVQGQIRGLENLLQGSDYADSLRGYPQYFDRASLVDYFIVNELCKNIDAYRLSTFLVKDRDSVDPRWRMGPVWDFNTAFGNVEFCAGAAVEGWVVDFNSVCPDNAWPVPFWWQRFWADPSFRRAVRNRWYELRGDVLSDGQLEFYLDSLGHTIGEAQRRNFERWPVLSKYVWPNWFVGDAHAEEMDYLSNWLSERTAWIDAQLAAPISSDVPGGGAFVPRVSPNPFWQELRLEYATRGGQEVAVQLFNAQGQLLLHQVDRDHPEGVHTLDLAVAELPAGIYFYQLRIDANTVGEGKLIKGR